MSVVVYVDGLCEPRNPGGVGTYGLIIYQDGEKIHEDSKVVGEGCGISNNVAEYSALCAALEWLIVQGIKNAEIRSDSMLVVRQMKGEWGCHGGLYVPKYHEALKLAKPFTNLAFTWIPREQNDKADALSRHAYEEYCRIKKTKARYHDDAKIEPNRVTPHKKETQLSLEKFI